MPGNIKGIIVEIGGDTSKLQKALNKVNSQSSSLSKELKGINSLLKLDPKNVELLSQKQEILNQSIDTTQDKLQQLQKIKEEADKKMASGGKISEENYRNLQREIISTQNKLNGLTDELKQFNAENTQLSKASKKIEEYGNKISKVSDKVNDLGNKASVASGAVIAGGVALANSAMSVEDAVAKYVSSTNTATNETEKYKTVLENINKANYGDGYEDIANSMAAVKMQLKDINDADLENITEKAIALRDLFGYDVSESIRSVKALMDNFNITADESFNLIAEGKKQGLDFSNELLDNINEYSVQFKKLGLSVEDMFNIFKVGSENGAFNLDKIGDAVKEFSIRAIDGSNTTVDGFKRIGLNADEMAKKFANGGDVAKQAFIEVVNRLGSMDDKVSQSIAGVDLFGTMWEDLGPTVISSFSKMDAGISKSSNSMQDSIDELYDTTKKKAETQLKRLQSLGADFGEEMLPVLEKIIDKAEDFIDCLEDMSDEEKENIAKIALLVAGFGPLTKVVGTAGSAIGTFSQAVGVATGKINSNSTSVNNLAGVLKGLTSPLGIGIGLFAALSIGAQTYVDKLLEIEPGLQKVIDKNSEFSISLNDSYASINKDAEAKLSEIQNAQKLSAELKNLVDANGEVKKGYEGRVNYILGKLNNAAGTEYKIVDGQIEKYKELADTIDTVLVKQEFQVHMAANEQKYTEAINNEQEALKNYTAAMDETKKKREEYNDALENGNWLEQYNALENLTAAEKAETEAQVTYGSILNTVSDYYEQKEILQSNDINKMQEYLDKQNDLQAQQTINTGASLSEQINQAGNYYTKLGELARSYNDIDATIQAERVTQRQASYEQELINLANQLANQTQKVEELTPEQIEAWKSLSDQSYLAYQTAINQLGPEMQAKIADATGVIASNTPEFAAQAGRMGDEVAAKFNEDATAKENALKTLQGFYEGLNDEEKKELLKSTVGERADEVAKEFESGDYQKSGENVLEGLYKGLSNGTIGEKLLSKAASIAKNIAGQFNIEWDIHSPSRLMKKKAEYLLQPIGTVFEKEEGKLKNISKSVAKSVIEGFDKGGFDKLLNINTSPKMQNTNIPSNTTNNNITYVANIYAQTVNEQNLKTFFEYMNRRFGNMY
jgi:TP901 family phage tail tape measure protein|nr:MAG TPA: minor tail protein [Caudoviricetes sp.]